MSKGARGVVSEYQYYEFVALDRPLTPAEMAELRSISTRAEITPTRFFNEYHWGDLKADSTELLARYFDVHVYFANWGSRRLMFRLPRPAVDLDDLRACVPGGPVTLTVTEHHVVLDLWSETEEPEEEWFEDGQLLASLTPLRAELLRGDRRVAYLAWLLAGQAWARAPGGAGWWGGPGHPGAAGSPRPGRPLGVAGGVDQLPAGGPRPACCRRRSGVEDAGEMGGFRGWVGGLPAR